MEWFDSVIEFFKAAMNPETILSTGGLFLVCLVVFAETGLLVGFFLPGDSLLLTAGLFWAKEDKNLWVLLLCLIAAAVVGDQVGYIIGRRTGPVVFRRKKSWFFKPEYVHMTRKFYNKYGGTALVLGRFFPIIRTFAPVMAGVVHLEYRRFVGYNIAGGVLWVVGLAVPGYLLGKSFAEEMDKYHGYIVIALVVLTAIPLLSFVIKEFRNKKVKAEKLQVIRAARAAARAAQQTGNAVANTAKNTAKAVAQQTSAATKPAPKTNADPTVG